MEQTVYLDLLFLVNFSMDLLCFFITSKIISVRFAVLRSVIASALGGIYADAALFLPTGYIWSFIADASVCLVMCAIVFYKPKEKGVIFAGIVYFSVSMVLGGAMTAIFNLLNRMGFDKATPEDEDGISVWLFALIAAVSALCTLAGGRFFKRRSSMSVVKVEVVFGGSKKIFDAMVDSGNLLRDPISGRGCIAADADLLCGLIPKRLIEMSHGGELSALGNTEGELMIKRSLRLIPARSATGEKMLIGVRADSVRIDAGKGFYESDAIIVISRIDGSGKGARALVPAELLR